MPSLYRANVFRAPIQVGENADLPLIQIPLGTRILRVDHVHESSAKVIVALTDLGTFYIKGPPGPEGNTMLLREWVGTGLADALGLQTFHYGQIAEPIPKGEDAPLLSDKSQLRGDVVFASKLEPGVVWEGGVEQLSVVGNTSAFGRLVVFDTWIRNRDRYYCDQHGREHLNLGNVFISSDANRGKHPQLLAVDHTHVFGADSVLDQGGASGAVIDSARYGLFPDFRSFVNVCDVERALHDLSNISYPLLHSILGSTPKCWGMSPAKAMSGANFLLARARHLCDQGARLFV